MPRATPRAVVAIPARDEASRIGACLDALAAQRPAPPADVALLLNNCGDATASIARGRRDRLPFRLMVREVTLPASLAHAGTARAMAMEMAAVIAGEDGVLLTTDADGIVSPDWFAGNLSALASGADAVMGRAVIDPTDARAIPQALHDADARECGYAVLLDEIAHLVCPDPADPWPRHTEESGASIAVSMHAWRAVGGMDPVRLGEDRAFAERLRRADQRIRHAPEVFVTVSGRIEGRARGGMADTIRRRLVSPDPFLDDRLEPALQALRRARWRRRVLQARAGQEEIGTMAEELSLPAATLRRWLHAPFAGQAWAEIAQASPRLERKPVLAPRVEAETAMARAILRRLRAREGRASVSSAGAAPAADSRAVAAE